MTSHVDDIRMNADGTMTVILSTFMNPTVGVSFDAAVVTGVCASLNGGTVLATITITPSVPIVRPAAEDDLGSSNSA